MMFAAGNFNSLRALSFKQINNALQGRLNIGIRTFAEIFFRQTDFQTFKRFVQITGVVFFVAFQAGGIALVKAGHGVQQNRTVFGRLRHRAGLVEAGSIGNHTET